MRVRSSGRTLRSKHRGFAMLLNDAVHAIETMGAVWLGISAVAFLLLGLFVEIRRKSAALDVDAKRDGLAEVRPSMHSRQLDLVAKTEKRPASKKAPRAKPPKLSWMAAPHRRRSCLRCRPAPSSFQASCRLAVARRR